MGDSPADVSHDPESPALGLRRETLFDLRQQEAASPGESLASLPEPPASSPQIFAAGRQSFIPRDQLLSREAASPPNPSPSIPAWVTAEQQHRIQGSAYLEEFLALTALSPFFQSVHKVIEALSRMPDCTTACEWVQALAATAPEGSHFPPELTSRATILPLWMEAANLRGLSSEPSGPRARMSLAASDFPGESSRAPKYAPPNLSAPELVAVKQEACTPGAVTLLAFVQRLQKALSTIHTSGQTDRALLYAFQHTFPKELVKSCNHFIEDNATLREKARDGTLGGDDLRKIICVCSPTDHLFAVHGALFQVKRRPTEPLRDFATRVQELQEEADAFHGPFSPVQLYGALRAGLAAEEGNAFEAMAAVAPHVDRPYAPTASTESSRYSQLLQQLRAFCFTKKWAQNVPRPQPAYTCSKVRGSGEVGAGDPGPSGGGRAGGVNGGGLSTPGGGGSPGGGSQQRGRSQQRRPGRSPTPGGGRATGAAAAAAGLGPMDSLAADDAAEDEAAAVVAAADHQPFGGWLRQYGGAENPDSDLAEMLRRQEKGECFRCLRVQFDPSTSRPYQHLSCRFHDRPVPDTEPLAGVEARRYRAPKRS